ncbi:ABC transporter ATP-binding protein [Planotetraspora phitsanulokensis]|uniref:Multidrug ABC transporter ATP-binding protein n=1 Tax=Planotetraspora phitsanulokensis TaxID=575192 RepID=A0A8J3U529_9ACTN|nr:ABC transporter ATP-binding protein [Planotetraspora phitsanulokensis]GII36179.1 multidrug ABC transporter ATP-binding protein [Planotetraspora phitsanulokensis]
MGGSGPSGRDVLRQAIKGQRRDVALGSLLGAGHQAGEALVPVLIGVVIDQAVAGGDATSLLVWLAVLAVVYVGLSFSFRFGARAGERAAEQAAHILRVRLVTRVVDPRGGAEDGRLPGALTSIATEDAKRVGTVAMAVMFGFSALMGLLVGAVVLLRISIPLGLVVLVGTPVLLLAGHLLSKPLERRSEAEQERTAHASGVAADLVTGLRVLKGIGAESAAVARYRRTSRDSLVATLRAARAEAVQNGLVLTLTGVFIAVVALVGGRLAVEGDISLGQLVSAVGLALFLLGPLEVFSWVNTDFAQARASATRIAGVLAAPPGVEPGGARLPERLRGALRLRGVGHGSLRGIDLDVAPGEVLGVAATDPADATALLRCLSRQADPDTGVIELDGVPLRDLDPADVRTAMLVAEHDADLFEGTLRGNVAAAASDPEAVLAAMAAAGADEVALAVPRGGDTAVSERGRSLSGGQRQRVALARALAADRPVLVVHDPTTAVDAVTEARIAAGVRDLRRGRTTILVTTSPALLAVADRVALLDGGRIADTGPHADLVERHAAYRTAVLS